MDEYEEYEEYEEESGGVNKILIGVIVVLVIAVGVVGFLLVRNILGSKETSMGLALSREDLEAAMADAQANAEAGNIALKYENDAYSEDGESFSCNIMNSEYNAYDMFLKIYADVERTDELFTSGLVAPGLGFDRIKLNHKLPEGTNTVYVVLSLVKTDEDGVQSIVGETVYTMDFSVG